MLDGTIREILSHLFRHRARTLLTMSGLVVGVFALTIIGSLAEAFNTVLSQEQEAALGTIRVRGRLTPTIRRAVRQVPGVAGTATTLWASLADPKEEREAGFQLIPEWLGAMDTDIPGREYGPPLVSGGLLEGRLPNPRATNEVLLDFDLARAHGWEVGDPIPIRGRPFVVAGILERPPLGGTRNAYIDHYTLRSILRSPPDDIHTLDVIPEAGQDAAELAARIQEQVPGTWPETPEQRQAALRREWGLFAAITGLSAGLALLAGSLTIVNTMLMSVRERRPEIGLKKALGASDGDIILEFLLEAGTLGALSGGVGVLLGWFLVLGADRFLRAYQGLALLSLTPRLAVGAVAFTALLGALAGVYPAWLAAREDPVRALRPDMAPAPCNAPAAAYAERGMKRLLYRVGRRARWLLTVAGISAGILILTVSLSLAEFLNHFTQSAASATRDQVVLFSWRDPFIAYTTTVRELERMEGARGVIVMASGGRVFEDDADMPLLSLQPPILTGLDSPSGGFGFNLPYRAEIERGRYLTPDSLDEVVLGPRLAEATGLDVGDVLTVRGRNFRVVGIWKPVSVSFGEDYSVHAYVTMAGLRRVLQGQPPFPELSVLVAPGTDPEALAARIREEMPEWSVQTSESAAREIRQAMLIFTLVLIGYVSLGLLVGGLAVMNTMVMAVMERTREIGLKKAVGASDGDVLSEIVEESGWVGMLGGALGLVVGWLLTIGINTFTQRIVGLRLLMVTPRLAIATLAFTAFLGMVAGLYPAWRASRLDPVQALRSE